MKRKVIGIYSKVHDTSVTSFFFTREYKAICKENLAIYQKSLTVFFQAPFHLKSQICSMVAKLAIKKVANFEKYNKEDDLFSSIYCFL